MLQREKTRISQKAYKIFHQLLIENPVLKYNLEQSVSYHEFHSEMKRWADAIMQKRPTARKYYESKNSSRELFEQLSWRDFASIRLMDYIDNEETVYKDPNLRNERVTSMPMHGLWFAFHGGLGEANEAFFADMLYMFRQLNGSIQASRADNGRIEQWMSRYPSGLEPEIVELRKQNKKRIIRKFIEKIDSGRIKHRQYSFDSADSMADKVAKMNLWWNDKTFHLQFAARTPDQLNDLLDNSLDKKTMTTLYEAADKGIPFFVNPYYLSLLDTHYNHQYPNADQTIRDYAIYNKDLIDQFGEIVAWEKEDIVRPGEPNAAGWILPSTKNIHRRYPEVAILIPETVGRACGGLCISCQRMYDFQSGHLNFDLDKLMPKKTWTEKLHELLKYYENDSQLRDILITGGDALMSTDKSLEQILDAVYEMALRKKQQNEARPDGEKYANIVRVRLGTRLPVYIPQRITPQLVDLLAAFKQKASRIGISQFVIQTHFESPMEVTSESTEAVAQLLKAGWLVTNQLVFTVAASRRGHTAKLRKTLNDIGVLTYYTFSVKGYQENKHNFAPNSRAMQEQLEEKVLGQISERYGARIKQLADRPEDMIENIRKLCTDTGVPFIATDRNVINIPGVGKSLTYRTIGITNDGRRILEFDHDATRNHSPVVDKMGKVIIIESKSIYEYLQQIHDYGEDVQEYENVYGYSIGATEKVQPIYRYPEYDYRATSEVTNFDPEYQCTVECRM